LLSWERSLAQGSPESATYLRRCDRDVRSPAYRPAAPMRAATRTLVVEARHLDTDDRSVARFEVDMPVDEPGQRAQLSELVAGLHPAARMRSFGGGAASFLDAEHLVVAHYVGREQDEDSAERAVTARPPTRQQSLFAA
jgi:hypothetical protein